MSTIRITIFSFFILFSSTNICEGQILISLIFGEKLNSDKMEFGLDGGINIPTLIGQEEGKPRGKFNLGFYIDFKFNNRDWMINTGIIGLSQMGANGIPVYSLGSSLLDSAFAGGSVRRELGYFNLPVVLKHKISKRFYLGGGVMGGLMYSAEDIFTKKILDQEDLSYVLDISDELTALDFGFIGIFGYRLLGGNGMNIAIKYYRGVIDISKGESESPIFNQSIYFSVGIPIGAGKANIADESTVK